MYPEKVITTVISKKTGEKLYFVDILKATDEKRMIRIRIRLKMSRIRNTGLETVCDVRVVITESFIVQG
jgi:hypothetical protein